MQRRLCNAARIQAQAFGRNARPPSLWWFTAQRNSPADHSLDEVAELLHVVQIGILGGNPQKLSRHFCMPTIARMLGPANIFG